MEQDYISLVKEFKERYVVCICYIYHTKLSHVNKKTLSPFYHKKIFLIEIECNTPYRLKVFPIFV